MSHTPGPWESDNLRVWAERDYEEQIYIASLKFADDTRLPLEEVEANVCLIAAAPDLLEACQEALAAVDEAYQATGYLKICKTSEQRLKIEAAIAKALGKEQT